MDDPAGDEDERDRALTQEERALQALRAISNGGDVTAEALKLSNEFTDGHTARFLSWLRSMRRPR